MKVRAAISRVCNFYKAIGYFRVWLSFIFRVRVGTEGDGRAGGGGAGLLI